MAELFNELDLLYGEDYKVNEYLTVHHPTLNDIRKFGERNYYNTLSPFISTPSDYKVQLFDSGIDYCKITDFELFLLLSRSLTLEDTSIILPTLDIPLSEFKITVNQITKQPVLYSEDSDVLIDNAIYTQISMFLCKIHYTKKTFPKTSDGSKKYFIERERRRQERHKNDPFKSMLVPEIVALVNCEQFKYDFNTVWDLPIFTFNTSIRQIQKLKHIDYVMSGIYAGTVDATKINSDELNWLNGYKVV